MTGFFSQAFSKLIKGNYGEIGAIAPFSKTTGKKLIQNLQENLLSQKPQEATLTIVEMGCGQGQITKRILDTIRQFPNAILHVFEVNSEFHEKVSNELGENKQLMLHPTNVWAEQIANVLSPNSVDAIISTLPLSSLPSNLVNNILKGAQKTMKPDTFFQQCQYSPFRKTHLETTFGPVAKQDFIWKNLPPTYIYGMQKKQEDSNHV